MLFDEGDSLTLNDIRAKDKRFVIYHNYLKVWECVDQRKERFLSSREPIRRDLYLREIHNSQQTILLTDRSYYGVLISPLSGPPVLKLNKWGQPVLYRKNGIGITQFRYSHGQSNVNASLHFDNSVGRWTFPDYSPSLQGDWLIAQ